MKRFLILLSLLFCNVVFADTINLHWRNYDGTTYQDSTCEIDSDLILPSAPPTRYGYTFTGWTFLSYIPIKYIESTGIQFIDLNILATYGYTYIAQVEYVSIPDSVSNYIFGSLTTNNGIFVGIENQLLTMRSLGTSDKAYGPQARTGVKYTYTLSLKQGNNVCMITTDNNDTYQLNVASNGTLNTYRFYLFGINFNNNIYATSNIKLYKFQVLNNYNTLVLDLVPALDFNGIPCMYDKVSDQFYYNQGTGQFIAGPVL